MVIGLMSGTSMDSIDAALVDIDDADDTLQVKTLAFQTTPYPPDVQAELVRTIRGETGVAEICHLNFLLGELFADAALQLARQAKVSPEQLLCIASHGQTVWHQPEPIEWQGRAIRSTLQIGELAVIAERTGVPVVGDFRTADVAAGGQGAPLVPYVDYLLFRHPEEGRILLNIGGIANLTAIAANASPEQVIAFDTGPGNALINVAMEIASGGKYRYDPEGSFAQRHPLREEWLNELLQHPYFAQPPPKSTGRETFGEAMGAQTAAPLQGCQRRTGGACSYRTHRPQHRRRHPPIRFRQDAGEPADSLRRRRAQPHTHEAIARTVA
jgi:anhydro-N-acetylmuramic acid kinase